MPKIPNASKAFARRVQLLKRELEMLPFHGKTCRWMCVTELSVESLIKRAASCNIPEGAALIAWAIACKHGLNHFGMVPISALNAVESRRYRPLIKHLFIPHPADPIAHVTIPEWLDVISYTAEQYGFGPDGKLLTKTLESVGGTSSAQDAHMACTSNDEITEKSAIPSRQTIRLKDYEKEVVSSLRSDTSAEHAEEIKAQQTFELTHPETGRDPPEIKARRKLAPEGQHGCLGRTISASWLPTRDNQARAEAFGISAKRLLALADEFRSWHMRHQTISKRFDLIFNHWLVSEARKTRKPASGDVAGRMAGGYTARLTPEQRAERKAAMEAADRQRRAANEWEQEQLRKRIAESANEVFETWDGEEDAT